MAEEFLQTAFEIKAVCDEISRRLLRWHWEQKPGAHSLEALLEHIEQRTQESPDYYERMPDVSGKTNWGQLETTVCMRVLLDPEKDAKKPLDLLGNTPHPGAARRACNAVRAARNEAAHAADRTDAARAAILFGEAVESLEEGYAGSALRTDELEQYYRMADEFKSHCGGQDAPAPEQPKQGTNGKKGRTASAQKSGGRARAAAGEKPARTSNAGAGKKAAAAGTKNGTTGGKSQRSKKNAKRTKREKNTGRRTFFFLLLAVCVLGVLARAYAMGFLAR